MPKCPACKHRMTEHCAGSECHWAVCADKNCGTILNLRDGHAIRWDTKSTPKRTQT